MISHIYILEIIYIYICIYPVFRYRVVWILNCRCSISMFMFYIHCFCPFVSLPLPFTFRSHLLLDCFPLFLYLEKLRMYSHWKKYMFKKHCVTITHGSKRGGMTTCIVIYLKTDFVNTNAYLKQCPSCFLNKSLLSWKYFKYLIHILWRCNGLATSFGV